MKRNIYWLLPLIALVATPAVLAAVAKGGKLYIKSHDTHLQKDTAPTAKTLATLDIGDEVVWNGPDAKDKKWHSVTAKGQTGVVFASNLTTEKPRDELVASGNNGQKVNPQAFASSGAATKAMSEAAIAYAHAGGKDKAALELMTLEQIAKLESKGGAK